MENRKTSDRNVQEGEWPDTSSERSLGVGMDGWMEEEQKEMNKSANFRLIRDSFIC